MAEINNFSQITENFDTIKTLLNSIRAQGILNTSDVDKLLAGINSKLEKLNTEEDIDLIKVFLSELKQNLDERHSVLISKFGAIESLFSNLLKNSADSLKSSEVKELFDIVATNLSVFSREVVSQKETLTDITLRLDALRSDDSQKKEIIKNISVLKNDLDHLSNGFDSIVLSLNENFKTLIKTLSNIDQSEAINKFGSEISDVVASANSILSAIQLLDKKNIQIEDSIKLLATQEDLSSTKKWISDLVIQNNKFDESINNLADKFYKIDNLAEKIDASVSIIAGIKTVISDKDDEQTKVILDNLTKLELELKEISESKDIENLRVYVEEILNKLLDGSLKIDSNVENLASEIQLVSSAIKKLGVDLDPQSVFSKIEELGVKLKEHLTISSERLSQLIDVNATKTINTLASNTEKLESQLKNVGADISELCIKNFADVIQDVSSLKDILSQLDDNNVSANNAIFANITDRLSVFENSLKMSLDKQEGFVSNSANQLLEQIAEIKNLSGLLDYKLDASVVEINNSKREFTELKSSVDTMLGLDFVNVVKDLRVDLYASKQELANAIDNMSTDITDKFSNDLFSKYELLVSKLDSLQDSINQTQLSSLSNIKTLLEGISSSIVDVISYVSTKDDSDINAIDQKLSSIVETVKDNNLNYIENVRDVVEVIRTQVENNLIQIQNDVISKIDTINETIQNSESIIKDEIKYSYNKLLEIQDNFSDFKNTVILDNTKLADSINEIAQSSMAVKADFEQKISFLKNVINDNISELKKDLACENADKLSEIKFTSENINAKNIQNINDAKIELQGLIQQAIGTLKLNIEELTEHVVSSSIKIETSNNNVVNFVKDDLQNNFASYIETLKTDFISLNKAINSTTEDLSVELDSVKKSIDTMQDESVKSLTSTLAQILENFVALKTLILSINEKNIADLNLCVSNIQSDFKILKDKIEQVDSNIDDDMTRQFSILEDKFASIEYRISELFDSSDEKIVSAIKDEYVSISDSLAENLNNKLDGYKCVIDNLFKNLVDKNDSQIELVKSQVISLNKLLSEAIEKQNDGLELRLNNILDNLKGILNESIKVSNSDFQIIKSNLSDLLSNLENRDANLLAELKDKFDSVKNTLDSEFEQRAEEVNAKFLETLDLINGLKNVLKDINETSQEKYNEISDSISNLSASLGDTIESTSSIATKSLEEYFSESIISKVNELYANISSLLSSNVEFITSNYNVQSANTITEIGTSFKELKDIFESLLTSTSDNLVQKISDNTSDINEIGVKVEADLMNISQNLNQKMSGLTDDIHSGINEMQLQIKNDISDTAVNLEQKVVNMSTDIHSKFEKMNDILRSLEQKAEESRTSYDSQFDSAIENVNISVTSLKSDIEEFLDSKIEALTVSNAELSAGELQTIEAFTDRIIKQILQVKDNTDLCKNLVQDFIQKEIDKISANIEAETDVIVKDIIEQFNLYKDIQKDEFSKLTVHLESSIEDYIYNHISDLKSYLDVKTDSSILNHKLDNLKTELDSSSDVVVESLNKLLETSVFTNAISDFKVANEILVSSMADNLNNKIQDFILNNVNKDINEKLTLFDKKFVDTIVDNYEEVKLIASKYNSSFDTIQLSLKDFISEFSKTKDEINSSIYAIVDNINNSIDELSKSFVDLKAQILNKSFDEAFQASLNNQISGIENLISKQFSYLEDISSLCCDNLPELAEMNTLVKHGIVSSVADLSAKIDGNSDNLTSCLNNFKSDIITQFINVFNQISFVAEQEEILDFIQEKHSELITILSHIVTTVDSVEDVKDNVVIIDNKLDSVKEDIDLINEKITAIMSSDGDINYVYSLQDLESDIANLRLILNEMKDDNKSKEFEELISSTNEIYKLVETLKTEFPKFEYEEFKQGFDALTEDIISISTRTNKLILASDESYKTLQDNLQDFKLVINDLDERIRNFAHEAGIDRIDNKLGAINTMIQNGAKTNQVFNQVFEYLAEWVDNAGEKINTISDKVDTLDDIGQIKVMLEDLKAEAEDNTDSVELIEALGKVFDKQAKKISSLESKLDRVIVETTINNKNNKLDMSPFEDTLNRFLVAIDDKFLSQQDRIKTLEAKLEEVIEKVDAKETIQLTKKVGGMDRQIAKLNKSIEKIASHVVEK